MNTDISRRLLVAALALAPTGVLAATASKLSPDDQALVDKAVACLQALNRDRGRFSQTDYKGVTATGDIYLQRPGKIRFEYDPPNDLRVISDGNQVQVQDGRLQTPSTVPLRTTPLALFLAKEIRLDRGVVVTSVDRGPDKFTITARDGGTDTAGQIIMVFANDPVALLGWTTIDAQKRKTRIDITSLKPVSALDPDLFRITTPRQTGHGR